LHTVSREDVLEVLPDAPVAGGGRGKSYGQLPKGVTVNTAPREAAPLSSFAPLNLIGRRAEESVTELDKFLDSAALGSVLRARVAHGHGMGVCCSKFNAAMPPEGRVIGFLQHAKKLQAGNPMLRPGRAAVTMNPPGSQGRKVNRGRVQRIMREDNCSA